MQDLKRDICAAIYLLAVTIGLPSDSTMEMKNFMLNVHEKAAFVACVNIINAHLKSLTETQGLELRCIPNKLNLVAKMIEKNNPAVLKEINKLTTILQGTKLDSR
ncbi:MAG: hypothetical protein LBJ93_00770 [Clostridiales bacterium]|nr:hypothetical protein [Clostridiales bacterium]